MSEINSLLNGITAATFDNKDSAKNKTFDPGTQPPIRNGVIIGKTDNRYTVSILGSSGDVLAQYAGVICQPQGDLAIGTQVWVVFIKETDGETQPVIMNTGGGGGCASQITDWGVLYD